MRCQCGHCSKTSCQLVVASADPAALLQQAEHPLNDVALPGFGRSNSLGSPGLGLRFIARSEITGCIR